MLRHCRIYSRTSNITNVVVDVEIMPAALAAFRVVVVVRVAGVGDCREWQIQQLQAERRSRVCSQKTDNGSNIASNTLGLIYNLFDNIAWDDELC